MKTDKEKYLKIFDTLSDALGSSEGQSIDEIKEELRDEGVNFDAALARLQQAQQRISMEARRSSLDSAREKRLKLVKRGHEFVGNFKDWSREQIIARIKELSKQNGPMVGVAYRELNAMGEEEITSILEDLEITHHRRNLEEDDNGE